MIRGIAVLFRPELYAFSATSVKSASVYELEQRCADLTRTIEVEKEGEMLCVPSVTDSQIRRKPSSSLVVEETGARANIEGVEEVEARPLIETVEQCTCAAVKSASVRRNS